MRWPRFGRQSRAESSAEDPEDPEDPQDPQDTHDPHARDRERMVADQLRSRGIRDPELLRAFGTVERHRFVTDDHPYGDHALPVGAGQTISQPFVVAVMTATAQPASGWHEAPVLEVGTGSGYQAAILAELGARVTSIERIPELADTARRHLAQNGYGRRVEVVVGDGTRGWPAGAPYRSIIVTAGGPSVPQPLIDQLDHDGGRLVMPVGDREHQLLTLVVRRGDQISTETRDPVVFVPLIGAHGHPSAEQGGE